MFCDGFFHRRYFPYCGQNGYLFDTTATERTKNTNDQSWTSLKKISDLSWNFDYRKIFFKKSRKNLSFCLIMTSTNSLDQIVKFIYEFLYDIKIYIFQFIKFWKNHFKQPIREELPNMKV
jgi:hypothetical protein